VGIGGGGPYGGSMIGVSTPSRSHQPDHVAHARSRRRSTAPAIRAATAAAAVNVHLVYGSLASSGAKPGRIPTWHHPRILAYSEYM